MNVRLSPALRFSILSLVAGAAIACGGSEPAPQPPQPEAVAPPVASSAPVAAEPTPEEKKKAADLAKLEADRKKYQAEHDKEVARWTPELHTQAKGFADKDWPSAKAALTVLTKASYRQPGDAERDGQRHPIETLEFFGLKPTSTVFEYGPGGGWYTELLAPTLAKKGKLVINNGDPKGPATERSTFYAQRTLGLLETSPELYGKVQTVVVDGKAPKLGLDGTLDLALVIRGLHGMVNSDTLGPWLAEIHTALKPKGTLAIEQHRAKEGSDPKESSKKGYLPEKWVIETIEAAGFKLAGKSEINANPKDTKDYPEGVWALPPTLERGDKDKAALQAIGESDRMTLKFTKVEAKADKAAAAKTGRLRRRLRLHRRLRPPRRSNRRQLVVRFAASCSIASRMPCTSTPTSNSGFLPMNALRNFLACVRSPSAA